MDGSGLQRFGSTSAYARLRNYRHKMRNDVKKVSIQKSDAEYFKAFLDGITGTSENEKLNNILDRIKKQL